MRAWLHDRALTLVLMGLFFVFWAGQLAAGWLDRNQDARSHHQAEVGFVEYLGTGDPWEATFENWESEFLQMAAFVLLTTVLVQVGSAESRRPHAIEGVDIDPRDFADNDEAPWPVRRGGWVLRLYEHSLGLAFTALFLISWIGHAIGGWRVHRAEQLTHGEAASTLLDYLASARFWFESFQNWQSEFLAIGAMVWLSVYLRQRYSPESKPVHAPHSETGR